MFSKNYPASDIQYSILNETIAQWYLILFYTISLCICFDLNCSSHSGVISIPAFYIDQYPPSPLFSLFTLCCTSLCNIYSFNIGSQ